MKGANNREMTYFLKMGERSLEAVRLARQAAESIPTIPDKTCVEDACKELGISRRTLRDRLKSDKGAFQRHWGKDRTGKRCRRSYVANRAIADAKLTENAKGSLTLQQAARILKRSPSNLHHHITNGSLEAISNGTLTATWGKVRVPGGPTKRKTKNGKTVFKAAFDREGWEITKKPDVQANGQPQSSEQTATDTRRQHTDGSQAANARRRRGRPTETEQHKQWKAEHDAGKSLTALAKKHHVTRRAVTKALAALGN